MKPNQIICGDNIDVVKSWPANCIDSIITDPPYGLEFMGKEWDKLSSKKLDIWGGGGILPDSVPRFRRISLDSWRIMQEWHYQWAKAMLRITKPGGFLLCFGGTRTYHRLTCAIEDAGWEIRDCMMWLYGSGFPKSHNIGKALMKKLGDKGVETGETKHHARKGVAIAEERTAIGGGAFGKAKDEKIKVPTHPLAQLWDGYGTALKPAWEPILVCMKPLDGTFAHNAEHHGVAGLNIDGGRIGTETISTHGSGDKYANLKKGKSAGIGEYREHQGRWPANLVLDEEAEAMLDEQTGTLKSGSMSGEYKNTIMKNQPGVRDGKKIHLQQQSSSGGASRFFYCAKTSRKERNMGMENCEDKLLARSGGTQGAENRGEKEYLQKRIGLNRVAVVKNNHPTVKPLALMKYLCTLLKMPSTGQIILDPFMGSGTTGIACKELGINFIGIEKEQEYCEISVKRITAVPGQEITLHTETTLPVSKNLETFRTTKDFAGGSRRPNENLPHVSEHRQSIIDAASAELRKRRNQK